MERASTTSIRVATAIAFAYAVYHAFRPVTLAEAQLWNQLIRPPLSDAFRDQDAWLGLTYALVAERFIGLFRLSELSLRMPSLLAGGICGYLLWRRPRPLYAIIYIGAAAAGWFSTAAGQGMAVAFSALGWYGMAIAACPPFLILMALFWRDVERTVIPSVCTAFILLALPLSHAAAPRPLPAVPEARFRSAVRSLLGKGPIRVGADPEVLPLLEFYRARYRRRDWTVMLERGQGWWFSATAELGELK